ncbi:MULTISPECIES: class I SAM-dependent methyltransferase [unclassified Nostoc]|uniref:class I SAM-dependent methyltransferase n=1 Tax=unclassified Nostoc TaxID=2593658 RepID=UPI002601AD15|nr:class I SAM-dependent methyltransferase [Nostoc sp. S13]MDF5734219.1 class I SAM-dependent methyltransferase [Nostoc sp. S13]
MSWDASWENIFISQEWGKYPPEDVIRFVARNFYVFPDRKQIKLLEIGCGTGANVWYMSREGFDVYGIDGSNTAIAKAENYLDSEGLKAHLQVGDLISLSNFYPPAYFDAVLDIACLQHNSIENIKIIVEQVKTMLKPGGRIFSMTVASGSWGDGLGKEVEPGTFIEITEGPLEGKGLCHFFNLEEVQQLSNYFADVQIEYLIRSLNNQQQYYKHWLVEGKKQL